MKINWEVRFKNPLFWAQVAAAVLAPILAYFGMNWADLTTWGAIGGLLLEAVKNPVVAVSVVVSVWNSINDPTTQGLSDSARALGYTSPHADCEVSG